MALIKCPECGKEISDKAASCPNCGFPITQGNVTQEPPQKQKEYDIEMLDSMRIKASKANIEVYYKGNLLLEANPMDFVLNYDKEEPDDLGRVQLKVAFQFRNTQSLSKFAYQQALPHMNRQKNLQQRLRSGISKNSMLLNGIC